MKKTITSNMFNKRTFSDEEIKKLFKEYKAVKDRAYVLEISGSPNSGKTSTIQAMDKIFRQNNIKAKIIYEAASRCKIKDKLSIDFNVWTANFTINSFLEALNGSYDIIVCERGVFDTLCWIEFHTKYKHLHEDYYKEFYDFYGSQQWLSKIDLTYVLTCSPDISIKREYLDGLTTVSGTIVNPDILTIFDGAIHTEIQKNTLQKIYMLDTSELDQISINRSVIAAVLDDIKISK